MSNSMDNKNTSLDNAISKLNFLWIARFKDETKICQIDEQGQEHRFQEVKNKFIDLTYFYLTNNKDKIFTVDLINGLVYFNNYQKPQPELTEKEKTNIRLIYFRRNFIDLGVGNIKLKHTIIYFLGFQYNDEAGYNHKILFQIDQEGNFVISGE